MTDFELNKDCALDDAELEVVSGGGVVGDWRAVAEVIHDALDRLAAPFRNDRDKGPA